MLSFSFLFFFLTRKQGKVLDLQVSNALVRAAIPPVKYSVCTNITRFQGEGQWTLLMHSQKLHNLPLNWWHEGRFFIAAKNKSWVTGDIEHTRSVLNPAVERSPVCAFYRRDVIRTDNFSNWICQFVMASKCWGKNREGFFKLWTPVKFVPYIQSSVCDGIAKLNLPVKNHKKMIAMPGQRP